MNLPLPMPTQPSEGEALAMCYGAAMVAFTVCQEHAVAARENGRGDQLRAHLQLARKNAAKLRRIRRQMIDLMRKEGA